MLVVTRGTVQHNGEVYVAGQPLPKMSAKDAQRLIELGAAAEMNPKTSAAPDLPEAPTAPAAPAPDDSDEEEGGDAPIDLKIDPAENIQSPGKKR